MTTLQNQTGLKLSYGNIYNEVAAAVNMSLANGTYSEVANLSGHPFTLDSNSTSDFAMTTDGRLKYIGLSPKTFLFNYLFSYAFSSGAFGVIGKLYKNTSSGTAYAASTCIAISSSNGATVTNGATNIPIGLIKDDYVSLYVTGSGGAPTITVLNASISCWSIS